MATSFKFNNRLISIFLVVFSMSSLEIGLAARHLQQLPPLPTVPKMTLPPMPAFIPNLPQPTIPTLPTTQPSLPQPAATLPPLPTVPNMPAAPKVTLPPLPTIPTIPTTIPSIPLFTPPPSN